MAEYIEREAAVAEILKGTITTSDLYGMGVMRGMDTALDRIRAVPAADVVPVVHGRWIETIHSNQYNDESYLTCSICGETFENVRWPDKWKGCPVCLARMDGAEC